MVAYNGVLDTLVAVAPKIRRNPAESAGFRRIVDHTYYVLRPWAALARGSFPFYWDQSSEFAFRVQNLNVDGNRDAVRGPEVSRRQPRGQVCSMLGRRYRPSRIDRGDCIKREHSTAGPA